MTPEEIDREIRKQYARGDRFIVVAVIVIALAIGLALLGALLGRLYVRGGL
jgi:hypothetical protein